MCIVFTASDNFFDESVEADKEFLDIATALTHRSGLRGLTGVQDSKQWRDFEKLSGDVEDLSEDEIRELDAQGAHHVVDDDEDGDLDLHTAFVSREHIQSDQSDDDEDDGMRDDTHYISENIGEHVTEMDSRFIPSAALNDTLEWEDDEEPDDDTLDNFIENSDDDKWSPDTVVSEQSLRCFTDIMLMMSGFNCYHCRRIAHCDGCGL